MDKKEKAFVVNALRRASLRWPARTKAKQAARVERGKYRCECCGQIVPAGKITIDHREPCVDPKEGFTSWDTYISRLFCERENLQALCKACHNAKSKEENKQRRATANGDKRKPTKRARKAAKRHRRPRKNKQVHSPEPPQE